MTKTRLMMIIIAVLLVVAGQSPCPAHAKQQLTDQQLGVLAGLATDSDWLRQQANGHALVYGIVRPGDQVPASVADCSYLIADNDEGPIVYYQLVSGGWLLIKSAPSGTAKLKTRRVKVSKLLRRYYRTVGQRQQVNRYVSELRTE